MTALVQLLSCSVVRCHLCLPLLLNHAQVLLWHFVCAGPALTGISVRGYNAVHEVLRAKLLTQSCCHLQVADQRNAASVDALAAASEAADWMDGEIRAEPEVVEEAAPEEEVHGNGMDPAVHAMLQGQHNYYNNVHVVQEQVGS